MARRAGGEHSADGVVQIGHDLQLAGHRAVQVADQVKMREAVEVAQAGRIFGRHLHAPVHLGGRDRLQRHPGTLVKRRADHADRLVGDHGADAMP
jgi:hypothetical protein